MSNKMLRTVIKTAGAPSAIGAYNQAIKVGKTIYISGQIGLDPATMKFKGQDVETQAEQALKNMGTILSEAGLSFTNVVKTTVLLADIDDFTKVNTIYQKFFKEPYPARAAYAAAGLPKEAKVEIEAIAIEDIVDK